MILTETTCCELSSLPIKLDKMEFCFFLFLSNLICLSRAQLSHKTLCDIHRAVL